MPNPDPSPANRFRPGQSGNPRGRPRGRPTPAALLRRAFEEGHNPAEIIDTIIGKAKAGDYRFCRLLLDRIEPVPRPQARELAKAAVQGLVGQIMAALTPSARAEVIEAVRRVGLEPGDDG